MHAGARGGTRTSLLALRLGAGVRGQRPRLDGGQCFQNQGLGPWYLGPLVLAIGPGALGLGAWVLGIVPWVLGLGFWAWGLGSQGLGLGLESKVLGLGS